MQSRRTKDQDKILKLQAELNVLKFMRKTEEGVRRRLYSRLVTAVTENYLLGGKKYKKILADQWVSDVVLVLRDDLEKLHAEVQRLRLKE